MTQPGNPTGQVFPIPFEGNSPQRFGSQSNRVGIKTIPLDDAMSEEEIAIGGTLLWAITASKIGPLIEVQLNDRTSGKIPYGQGQMIRGVPFSSIFITHDAQPGQYITFLYATEEYGQIQIDNPMQETGAIELQSVAAGVVMETHESPPEDISMGADITLIANTTTLVISPSNIIKEIILQSHPENTDYIRVGPGTIAQDKGFLLGPGQMFSIKYDGPMHAFTQGTGQKIITASTIR